MKKYLILCFILTFALTSVNAQDKDSKNHDCENCDQSAKFAPKKGDFTAAMVFGRGAYLNGGLTVPSSNIVSGETAYDNTVNANNNSITNMVGAEGRYYVGNKFALTLSGGAILRNNPGVLPIPGVPNTNVPTYAGVDASENVSVNLTVGAQWMFTTKNERLFPYLGFALPFDYARQSLFTEVIIDDNNNITLPALLGTRQADISAFGVQAVAGVDYYIAKDLFFGFDIKPVSYTYIASVKTPGSGLLNLETENNTVSFFAQYSFKLGFKF